MKLESIRLHAPSQYEDWRGYRGEIVFDGPKGKVQINLTDALSTRVLNACAEELVSAARAVATELTANVIETAASAEPAQIETAKTEEATDA